VFANTEATWTLPAAMASSSFVAFASGNDGNQWATAWATAATTVNWRKFRATSSGGFGSNILTAIGRWY
jgi:hypothetical protein